MEKIKQALEKARKERDQASSTRAPDTERPAVDRGQTSFSYTQTRMMDGSANVMREKRLISAMDGGQYVETMKILSAQVLRRLKENSWVSLAITSPHRQAGASTVALNLGMSIAKEVEYTVMVVDADIREPGLHRYFGIECTSGLSDYLTDQVDLSSLLVNPAGIDHFVLLPGGRPVGNSAELLGSPRMCSLVEELANRYPKRIIIFDLPSLLDTSDALRFLPSVDAALLVIEDDETKQADVRASLDVLSGTNVLGTVLNKSIY